MRRRNPRLIVVGAVLFVMAVAFYPYMMSFAPRSNDPAELSRVVGMVSGTVAGLALALVIGGSVGTRVKVPVRGRRMG